MLRRERHPLAGKIVRLRIRDKKYDHYALSGQLFRLEDWWSNISGESWRHSKRNPACIQYAARAGLSHLPHDEEVVCGKVGAFVFLIHNSELGEEVPSLEVVRC